MLLLILMLVLLLIRNMKRIFIFVVLFSFCICGYSQDVISLAGEWKFCMDSLNVGESEFWFRHNLKDSITLPGITDESGYGKEFEEKGKLSRLHKYVGKAWYQTYIDIPKSWNNKSISLFLERVMWKSDIWVDNKKIGSCSSLATPHKYSLGKLSSGRHRLTIRIDNSEIYPIGNLWSHSYGDQTQIIWNGILGRIELSAQTDEQLVAIRTFPSMDGKMKIEFVFNNVGRDSRKIFVSLGIKELKSKKKVYTERIPYILSPGRQILTKYIQIDSPLVWDEFTPNMYILDCVVNNGTIQHTYPSVKFGFRSLSKDSDYIIINNIPRYLRGNLDCAVFPLKGYPPMDKKGWVKILKHYKDYGFNHVRFHSWTPPEAAFDAADELGLYVLCEVFWRDAWMGKGLNTEKVAPFIRSELFNISNEYGNHPSFIMQAIGNELGGFDINTLDPIIADVKKYDNRRFYLTSVRRPATQHADIAIQGNLSSPYPRLFIDKGFFSTEWDYRKWYGIASSLPNIQHEVGQWVVYPDWNVVDKYTGLLRSRDMEKYRNLASQYGVLKQNSDFVTSSGKQSISLYKENIESFLRTPGCAGFQLLGMQDFTGQGVALIGWLDAFYDNKGIVTPKEFRQWCNNTVPLMRTKSRCLTNEDTLKVDLEVFHFALKDLQDVNILWKLVDMQKKKDIASGTFRERQIRNAHLNPIGQIIFPLNEIVSAKKILLCVSIEGTKYQNSWNFWIFPNTKKIDLDNRVIETHNPDSAISYMNKGYNVLLWAYNLGEGKNTKFAQWVPAFWNGGEDKDEGSVNGALIQAKHPALAGFPTESFLDYQWYDICRGGKAFEIRDSIGNYFPIVQPIHDFHFNRKLGSIMEFKGQNGGKIFICGYNLKKDVDIRPEALCLRNSIYNYLMSEHFNPTIMMNEKWFKSEFKLYSKEVTLPIEFRHAVLYVKAGAKLNKDEQNIDWNIAYDGVITSSNQYGYDIGGGKIGQNGKISYWKGQKISFNCKLPFDYDGFVKIHIIPELNVLDNIQIYYNGNEIDKKNIDESGWVTIKINSGETLYSKASVNIMTKNGKDCFIDELVFVK